MVMVERTNDVQRALARDLACRVGVLYLVLPLAVFFCTWFRYFIGIPIAMLMALGFLETCMVRRESWNALKSQKSVILLCAVSASVFLLCNGGSPILETTWPLDLQKHVSIEHDLVSFSWPVTYFAGDGASTILRYALGYYLVPAALAKAFASSEIKWFVYTWSAIGLCIALFIVTTWARSTKWAIAFVIGFLLWGGLNSVGAALTGTFTINGVANAWMYARHNWLIGSNTFSIALTPQHAIAAWIAGVSIFSCWQQPWFRRVSGLLIIAVAFWSPFVAIPFAILVLGIFVVEPREAVHTILRPSVFIATVPVAVALSIYLGADASGVPFSFRPPSSISDYLLFVCLEFLLIALAAVLASRRVSWLLMTCIAILGVLPFFMGGVANDLLMRGSMSLTTVIGLYAFMAMQDGTGPARVAVIGLIVAGAACSVLELHRQIIAPHTQVENTPIFVFPYPLAPQYLAQISEKSPIAHMLKHNDAEYLLEPLAFDADWERKGDAHFDERSLTVSSLEPTNAALVAQINLLPGTYRIRLDLDWDLKFTDPKKIDGRDSNIQVSIGGTHKLLGIDKWKYVGGRPNHSEAHDRVAYAVFDILPKTEPNLSFGLGDQHALGKGFIRLNSLSLQRVIRRSTPVN